MSSSYARRWSRCLAAGCLAVLASLQVSAQTTASPQLRFELATIKPTRPDNPNSNLNFNRGHVSAENCTLSFLLKEAFGLNTGSDDQIVDAPAWVRTTGFDIRTSEDDATARDIEAMAPDAQKDAIDEMLRGLIEERFHLKAHLEYEPRIVAALVVSKRGAKLKPAGTCDVSTRDHSCQLKDWQGLHNSQGHIEGRGATTAMLANVLAMQPDVGGRMVVDSTGLTEKYSFDLRYTPDSSQGESVGPSLFSALEEQLGLKLETKKLPIKVLIIEQVDRPSPN